MTEHRLNEAQPIFVPVALSELEAVAMEAAAAAMFTSAPVDLGVDHPLLTGALKVRAAREKAKEDARG